MRRTPRPSRLPARLLACGGLAAAAFAATTLSGEARGPLATIRGRVEWRRELPPIEPRLAVNDLGMHPPRDGPDRRRSVVYLDTAPQGAFEESERPRAVLDQRNQTFVPYVLSIRAGTTVEFPNSDRTYHNVFSFSKAKRFDLGRYARGQSKSVRFDQPGVVRVFCEMHSHMSAYILVFAHRYFATTGADGHYQIEDVPPGTYTAMAWSDGETRGMRTVRVPEGGLVELDFVID
jgi:plastocyanin